MKLLLCACLLFAALASRAEVVIYKLTQAGTVIGQTNNVRRSLTGYIVIDPESGEFQLIDVWSAGKVHRLELEAWPVQWFGLKAVKSQPYTGFRVLVNTNGSQAVAVGYGVDAAVKISATNTIQMPRSMTAKPQTSFVDDAGDGTIWDSTLAMSFSSKDTLNANANGQTVTDVINALKANYQAKGYTTD